MAIGFAELNEIADRPSRPAGADLSFFRELSYLALSSHDTEQLADLGTYRA